MIDLVDHETLRYESRFLEQACGEGVFLKEVLKRKIINIHKKNKDETNFVKNLIIAVSSIYGIDIQNDNVIKCRDNLYKLSLDYYLKFFKNKNEKLNKTLKTLLELNIVCGNCLSMKTPSDNELILSEWTPIDNMWIIRKDYLYTRLLKDEKSVFIPKVEKEYRKVKYIDIGEVYGQ